MNSNVSGGVVVFMRYIAYKKHCARECTQPVSYVAWMWLQGLLTKGRGSVMKNALRCAGIALLGLIFMPIWIILSLILGEDCIEWWQKTFRK